jgi:hypothetical protein
MPPHETHDDQRLVQYLLGLLPPNETERLDEASIVDDDVVARLRIVEDDLVDEYARGRMAGDTLRRFEAHYLSSPRRRGRVVFARRFVRVVDRSVTPSAAPAPNGSRLRVVWGLAAAAAVLLLVCGTLAVQTIRLGRLLGVAQTARASLDGRARDLERQVDDLHAANAGVVKELERIRTERMRTAVTAAVKDQPPIALVLVPQTRAIGPIPALAIPPGAARVAFALRLEANEAARYQVGLRDPAVNQIVWRSPWRAATASGGEPSVFVTVPAGVLKPQHYSFDLTAQRPGDSVGVIGSYVFEIAPR